MAETWDTALRLRNTGINIRAVTSWSLLGSKGWNTLLTETGIYEPGVFDVRSGTPRPTAMVPLLRGLADGADRHPVLNGAGWWRRPVRRSYPAVARPASMQAHLVQGNGRIRGKPQPLLICGATGTLGQAFAHACAHRNIAYRLMSRQDMAVDDSDAVTRALDEYRPWAVINATGWVRVDDAEDTPSACFQANTTGARLLAEAALSALSGSHLVVRTAGFFSPFDTHNFAMAVVRALKVGQPFPAADAYLVSPTYMPHLVDAALDLSIDGAHGIWHLSNGETMSWVDFARKIARATGRWCKVLPTSHWGGAPNVLSLPGLRATRGPCSRRLMRPWRSSRRKLRVRRSNS